MAWKSNLETVQSFLALETFEAAAAWLADAPDLKADPYGFSKQCIIVYTQTLAGELARRGVRINCISPSPTASDFMSKLTKEIPEEAITPADVQRRPLPVKPYEGAVRDTQEWCYARPFSHVPDRWQLNLAIRWTREGYNLGLEEGKVEGNMERFTAPVYTKGAVDDQSGLLLVMGPYTLETQVLSQGGHEDMGAEALGLIIGVKISQEVAVRILDNP